MKRFWQRLRGQWFRLLLVLLSLGLIAGALFVVFQPPPAAARPTPLPIKDNEYEIAWLYVANNTAAWERFVAAVRVTGERLRKQDPQLDVEAGSAAFPLETTAVPEVALRWRDTGTRLVFRWYKLTSDWKTRDWVQALTQRQPPPLAIIGGSSSDGAREVAMQLDRASQRLPEEVRPLLLLTTATADQVVPESGGDSDATDPGERTSVNLMGLYPERSFRYCFTNRQMAAAIVQFIWQNDNLRPDSVPIHTVRWGDDSYSLDLIEGFLQALRQRSLARMMTREWGWTTGSVVNGLPPFALAGGYWPGIQLNELSASQFVDSSVGTFSTPNRFESKAAGFLLDEMERHPQQHRPLLIVSGQSQPSRRFLRAIARAAPDRARHFVVATGDTLSFNTIFRDRMALWPIQDLPFSLVFFCHHNPTDAAAGFDPTRDRVTGTEDLLLFGDIVETLAVALNKDGQVSRDAGTLGQRLHAITLSDGKIGFDPDSSIRMFGHSGNRRSGTGEHVVSLRPHFQGERVLPEAEVEVWARHVDAKLGPVWSRFGEPMIVHYDDAPGEGDIAP